MKAQLTVIRCDRFMITGAHWQDEYLENYESEDDAANYAVEAPLLIPAGSTHSRMMLWDVGYCHREQTS